MIGRLLVCLSAVGCAEGKPAGEQTPPTASQAPRTPGAGQALRVSAQRAMQHLQAIVAFGRRAPGSPGQKRQQEYLRAQILRAVKQSDRLEADAFTASTPVGKLAMTNFIAKFPGTTQEVIVVASHYDTAYGIKNFVGANDGGSSTALLLAMAEQLSHAKIAGPSVWLVWLDGEEAIDKWTDTDSLYGSRHLAGRWQQDGTAKRIQAFILTDMIGDRDLNIDHDENSTAWLSALVLQAATNLNLRSYFYARRTAVEDDHMPFLKAGVPAVDLIDLDYGYNNVFWHTPEDTLAHVSAHSMEVTGNVVFETLRLLGLSASAG